MMPHDPSRDPELQAFLRPWGARPGVPAETRCKALEHARAIVDAGGVARARPARLPPSDFTTRRRILRVALAMSLVMVVGVLGAFAALRGLAVGHAPIPAAIVTPPNPPVAQTEDDPIVEPPNTPAPEAPTPVRPGVAEVKGDSLAAEVEILRKARAAYTRQDFSGTLALVGEHARRFPRGHLAEQREALRVRSLMGAGRIEEARRAAAAFASRFPRSVLLSRVAEELGTSE